MYLINWKSSTKFYPFSDKFVMNFGSSIHWFNLDYLFHIFSIVGKIFHHFGSGDFMFGVYYVDWVGSFFITGSWRVASGHGTLTCTLPSQIVWGANNPSFFVFWFMPEYAFTANKIFFKISSMKTPNKPPHNLMFVQFATPNTNLTTEYY